MANETESQVLDVTVMMAFDMGKVCVMNSLIFGTFVLVGLM